MANRRSTPCFLEHVYEHIGVTWTIEEREKMLRKISYRVFPPSRRADAWQGCDRTRFTENNQFFYSVTASLGVSPSNWFKNLRLLQVRKKLWLISSLRVSMSNHRSYLWRSPYQIESLRESSWRRDDGTYFGPVTEDTNYGILFK